jgi:hypothetical protein
MTRILLTAAAIAALATAAQAQIPASADVPAHAHAAVDYDANHDGKVTLDEFKAGQAARLDRLFARLDKNHDGKLTKDELDAGGDHAAKLARLAGPDGTVARPQLEAFAGKRFERADTNHDGWLSPDELSNMHQRMRGAQGTE